MVCLKHYTFGDIHLYVAEKEKSEPLLRVYFKKRSEISHSL